MNGFHALCSCRFAWRSCARMALAIIAITLLTDRAFSQTPSSIRILPSPHAQAEPPRAPLSPLAPVLRGEGPGVRGSPATYRSASESSAQPQPLPPVETVPTPPPVPPQQLIESRPQQQAEGLSLASLEQMALANNPALARAGALVGAAKGNYIQAGLCPNPTVGYEGQQLGSGGLAEQQGVLFSQELVTGGKLRLNRAVAASEQQIAQRQWAAQTQRVLTDVRLGFYEVLVAQRQIDLATQIVGISGEGAKAADALLKAQEVGRADVLQAQLEQENAQVLLVSARNRHEAAWRSLAAIIGMPHLPPQPLIGDVAAAPAMWHFDEALARLRAISPEVAAAAAEVQRAGYALERARVQPIPNVYMQGLVNAVDNGIGGRPDGGVAVTAAVPLFDRNQGAVLKAQHELAAAKAGLAQIELDLQSRLAPVYEQYASALNMVQRYHEKILPAAAETLDLTRQLYRAGETGYVTLLTAQRTFSQTHWNYWEAVRQLRQAEVKIEGLLLSGSLQFEPGTWPREIPPATTQPLPAGGLETFRK